MEGSSGWEGKWGDREGMLAIAAGLEVESSLFLLHVSLLIPVERDKRCVIFKGCFMTPSEQSIKLDTLFFLLHRFSQSQPN